MYKQLLNFLSQVECKTSDFFKLGKLFLKPNLHHGSGLTLYVKIFSPETMRLE